MGTFKVFLSASSSSRCNKYRLKNWTMFMKGECKPLNGYFASALMPETYYMATDDSCNASVYSDEAGNAVPALMQYTDVNCTMPTMRWVNVTDCSEYLTTTDDTLTEQYLVDCGYYSGARQAGLVCLAFSIVAAIGVLRDAL